MKILATRRFLFPSVLEKLPARRTSENDVGHGFLRTPPASQSVETASTAGQSSTNVQTVATAASNTIAQSWGYCYQVWSDERCFSRAFMDRALRSISSRSRSWCTRRAKATGRGSQSPEAIALWYAIVAQFYFRRQLVRLKKETLRRVLVRSVPIRGADADGTEAVVVGPQGSRRIQLHAGGPATVIHERDLRA